MRSYPDVHQDLAYYSPATAKYALLSEVRSPDDRLKVLVPLNTDHLYVTRFANNDDTLAVSATRDWG